jgi:hypothetical protein
VNTFLFGAALGNPLAESNLMRRDEVKTIFSVYQIWLEETRGAVPSMRHEEPRVTQSVPRQVKSLPHKTTEEELFSPRSALA